MTDPKNVLGGKLEVCCSSPLTGFRRNGKCETGRSDLGTHVVCAQVTEKFLAVNNGLIDAHFNDASQSSEPICFGCGEAID
ncbi:MAG: DUF2237 family protein [Desulfobacterales bacterium]|jgi:hypothetical protein